MIPPSFSKDTLIMLISIILIRLLSALIKRGRLVWIAFSTLISFTNNTLFEISNKLNPLYKEILS